MDFKNNTNKYIEINLDDIFDENGYIINDYELYNNNYTVKKIKLKRTKNNTI